MRSRWIIFLGICLIVSISLIFILFNFANDLQTQLARQESLIKKQHNNESVYAEKTKKYADVITKYIYECNIIINNKKVSTDDVVKVLNGAFQRRDNLVDSIKEYERVLREYEKFSQKQSRELLEVNRKYYSSQDSLEVFKWLVTSYEEDYKIKYQVKKSKGNYTLSRPFGRVDSALLLFPYYKNKLQKDSIKNQWLIIRDINK